MAVDMFLKLDGIDGESTKEQYLKWIEIESFNWGVSEPITIGSASSGAGAGKAVPADFTVVMPFSAASPQIFDSCVRGSVIPSALLSIIRRNADGAELEFLKFEFDTVFTTKIDWSGPGDEGPEEEITFVFGSIDVRYVPQASDGSVGSPVEATWNFIKNSAD